MFKVFIDPVKVLVATDTVLRAIVRQRTNIVIDPDQFCSYLVDSKEVQQDIISEIDFFQTLWMEAVKNYELTHKVKIELKGMFV